MADRGEAAFTEMKLDASEKAKIQAFVAKKLASISNYSDDVLPEYVMVMVQNKKSKTQVSTDLEAFLGPKSSEFAKWLWEILDNYSKGLGLKMDTIIDEKEKKPSNGVKIESVISTTDSIPQVKSKLASVIAPASLEKVLPNEQINSRLVIAGNDLEESEEDDTMKEIKEKRTDKFTKESAVPERYQQKPYPYDEMDVEDTLSMSSGHSISSVIGNRSSMDEGEDMLRPMRKMKVPARLVLAAVEQAANSTKHTKKAREIDSSESISANRRRVKVSKNSRKEKKLSKEKNDHENVEKRHLNRFTFNKEEEDPNAISISVTFPERPVFNNKKRTQERTESTSMELIEAEPIVTETRKKVKRIRCGYWPQCTKGDSCLYHHPSEPCKNFPACSYGDQCLYIHPSVSCKYGAKCTRPDCAFNHLPPLLSTPGNPKNGPPLCKFGSACNRQDCTFKHPLEACKFGKNCTKGASCQFSHAPLCMYGANCNRSGCTFAHPKVGSDSKTICKFGSSCQNKETCRFSHPDEDVWQLANSLPKTPPRDNELLSDAMKL